MTKTKLARRLTVLVSAIAVSGVLATGVTTATAAATTTAPAPTHMRLLPFFFRACLPGG